MEAFARLYTELDATTGTLEKVAALKRYFEQAAPADAAWGVYFLAGGRPRQVIATRQLRALACEAAGIEDWLFEESYQAVGDLAETIAHVLPPPRAETRVGLAEWVEQRLLPLRGMEPAEQTLRIRSYWDELDWAGRFLLAKLIGGGFRVGVSRLLVTRALAEFAGLDPKRVAQRMMGFTSMVAEGSARPDAERYLALLSHEDGVGEADAGQPYPFFLAHQVDLALEQFPARLGPATDWLVEWKYDGIRGQLVKRAGQVWLWSRGEELVTDRFPEVVALAEALPDGTVLDGEILVWKDDRPAPFALLQQRIGRKTLTKKVLAEAPVSFIAYDVLEWQGQDQRGLPQWQRRRLLESLRMPLSPVVQASDWPELAALREQSRARGVEGFMLKHREAGYGVGRTKAEGTWWKWKIDPMSVDAVLIYAQRGHGRRASLYTDYTFAVWNRAPADAAEARQVVEAIGRREPPEAGRLQLVPFAKAYSGLTDEEFRRIDAVIRRTTLEKFGPVRSLKPTLVFELGFEGINRSSRHKSGIAVRFPRMLRIRDDKPLHEADTLQSLEALLGV
ncbi:ATP-dependent DNA ligase [Aquabacterium sp. A7-Y]|uniref:ATP-dependent DNA ligase n=1 Tax=Aquabacterium sp. A7-Y TaxID=1349605 RepID=UPI00223D851A|nr:ATP-dependent DNA ligase [Aquabacterium sp. A7-Y]MCW7541533.1 ATP-dependent DNA ligase [Aquabacterium sp. A7-Y]